MSLCPKCNRESACLHVDPIPNKELYFLIGFIVFISQLVYVVLTNIDHRSDIYNISLFGSYAVVNILVFLLVMYLILGKQYIAIFFGCHQLKERSFQRNGKPFILCARCTGIMVGMFLSPIAFIYELPVWIIILLALPLVVDGFVQRFTKWESKNYIRLITGIMFAPIIVVLYSYANYYVHLGFTFLAKAVVSIF